MKRSFLSQTPKLGCKITRRTIYVAHARWLLSSLFQRRDRRPSLVDLSEPSATTWYVSAVSCVLVYTFLPVLPCPALSCPVLPCHVLSCHVLSCPLTVDGSLDSEAYRKAHARDGINEMHPEILNRRISSQDPPDREISRVSNSNRRRDEKRGRGVPT